VTFQVALVGTDGILLGSDRLALYYTPLPTGGQATQRTETTKFRKSDDRSVICFFAGSGFAGDLAQTIAAPFKGNSLLEWETPLRNIASSFRQPPMPGLFVFNRKYFT